MNALTRFETSTPVRYDVMNAMCTEVEARDTDLQQQINDLNELFSNSIRKNYPIGAGATQEITFERGIWLITIEATGLSASEFMYTGVLSFINQYAGNLTQLSRLDFGTSTNINITASANGFTILNGTTSDGIFQVRQVLLQGRIEDMVQAITESLSNAKAYTDTETAKRVLQTIYDAKMATLDTKNTEQDTAISEKVKVNGTATNVNFIGNDIAVETVNGKKFASNTDIIKDRANRTAEQINRTFYKQFCKEFTSGGADIVVGNGMDGYVLSGEIKGQTVKCVADKNIKTTLIQSSTKTSALTSKATDTNAKIYTYVFYASRIVGTPKVQLTQSNDAGSAVSVVDAKLGINTKTFTSNISDIGKIGLNSGSSSDAEIDIDYVSVVEGNVSLSGYVPFGLSSTKAIIQNNGLQYPIYASEADKTSNIPISLGGVGGVYDTLTINEDGSGVLVQNTKPLILNGSENWITSGAQPTDTTLIRFHIASDLAINSNYENVVLADKLNSNKVSTASTTEGISGNPSQSQLNIAILKAKLATQDSAGFKTWLQANPLTVRYQLATPITTYIDKSLMPTILTTKANAINLNSVVKASSLKVSLPVDRITELQSQVTALQNAVLLLQS